MVVQLLTTGLQFSFGILYLHVLRVYGESGVLATAWPGVLCLATSYGLTPVLCCPLFSFLPLHCAGAGGVLQAKEHQADRRGGRAHHGPRHPLHFICQGASPGDHTLCCFKTTQTRDHNPIKVFGTEFTKTIFADIRRKVYHRVAGCDQLRRDVRAGLRDGAGDFRPHGQPVLQAEAAECGDHRLARRRPRAHRLHQPSQRAHQVSDMFIPLSADGGPLQLYRLAARAAGRLCGAGLPLLPWHVLQVRLALPPPAPRHPASQGNSTAHQRMF